MAERGDTGGCGIDGADEYIREVPARSSQESRPRDRENRSKPRDRDREARSSPRRSRSRERDRHTSRDRSPSRERANLGDRLIAMSNQEGGEKPKNRGEWLEKEHKKLLEEKGVESDSEPTEELIRQQVMLPTRHQIETQEFKEPIID